MFRHTVKTYLTNTKVVIGKCMRENEEMECKNTHDIEAAIDVKNIIRKQVWQKVLNNKEKKTYAKASHQVNKNIEIVDANVKSRDLLKEVNNNRGGKGKKSIDVMQQTEVIDSKSNKLGVLQEYDNKENGNMIDDVMEIVNNASDSGNNPAYIGI